MYQSLFEFLTRNPDATLQDLVDAFPDADLAFAIQKLHEYGYIRQPTFEDAKAWATAVTERGAAKAIEAITKDYRKSPEYQKVLADEALVGIQTQLDVYQESLDFVNSLDDGGDENLANVYGQARFNYESMLRALHKQKEDWEKVSSGE